MNLKVCIVGCGAIADSHVEEIKKLAGIDVAGVCDREPLMAEQLAVRYGIRSAYSDFTLMLSEMKPDVVHITTPPQSHVELAIEAIDAGCHVLVEKPLAINFHETRRLVDHARRAGRKLTVGHTYQFDPPAITLRRLVAAGALGDVVHVESYFGYNLEGSIGRGILGSPEHWVHGLPGNLLQNNLSHALAKVVEFLPEEAPTVSAIATRGSDHQFDDVRDSLYRELRVTLLAGGVTAYVTFTCSARPITHGVRVFGTKNTAYANFVTRTVTLECKPALPSALGRMLVAFPQGWEYHREGWKNVFRFLKYQFHFQSGMNELFRRFYQSIRDDHDPPISDREILTTAQLMDEILAQTASGDGSTV